MDNTRKNILGKITNFNKKRSNLDIRNNYNNNSKKRNNSKKPNKNNNNKFLIKPMFKLKKQMGKCNEQLIGFMLLVNNMHHYFINTQKNKTIQQIVFGMTECLMEKGLTQLDILSIKDEMVAQTNTYQQKKIEKISVGIQKNNEDINIGPILRRKNIKLRKRDI